MPPVLGPVSPCQRHRPSYENRELVFVCVASATRHGWGLKSTLVVLDGGAVRQIRAVTEGHDAELLQSGLGLGLGLGLGHDARRLSDALFLDNEGRLGRQELLTVSETFFFGAFFG